MSMSEALSVLYFNKTLSHKSSERSSLVTDPRLSSSPPEVKNTRVFHGSATTFHLGSSSGILQDKVRMLGALVLCSPGKHIFCCTLLTLWCACVCDWLKEAHMREARSGSKSLVLRWSHTTYGRNPVGGLYRHANVKRHPMSPPGEQTKMDEMCGWHSPFLAKLSGLFDHLITSWELELLT